MILNDVYLRKFLESGLIAPSGSIQPASVDLHLGATMKTRTPGVIDPEKNQQDQWHRKTLQEERFYLQKHVLALAPTQEFVQVPRSHVGFLHGLSSLGRLGLLVHVTAGLIDPGNKLVPTLELYSLAGDIWLRPGMRICQVTYHMLVAPAEIPYKGKYRGDTEAVASRMYEEYVHAESRIQETDAGRGGPSEG